MMKHLFVPLSVSMPLFLALHDFFLFSIAYFLLLCVSFQFFMRCYGKKGSKEILLVSLLVEFYGFLKRAF